MEPVNVCELRAEEFKQFLDSFDHVFSDCDGVIWSIASDAYPQSGTFYALMKKLGKTVHFVSNNSERSKHNYEEKFKDAGIKDGCENLTIPSRAIAEYLNQINLKKKAYCIACPETVNVLLAHGIRCETGPELPAETVAAFAQYLKDDEEIGAVVFDNDVRVNLAKLHKACTYLARPDVHFVNGASDRLTILFPGTSVLSTGGFTDLVAGKVNRTPVQMGKPGKEFGEFAMKRAGVDDPSRVLFIGDMIEQDVALGKAVGFKTLLVLTSATKEGMLAHPKIKPDFYAQDLSSIVPLLSAAVAYE